MAGDVVTHAAALTDADGAAYLGRLGLEAELPAVDALVRLHRAHVEQVPYETTWIHMGERWGIDRLASLRRIAYDRRGGYCFHLNGAFSLLLDWLGYDVTLHVGGVHGPEGPTHESMANHLVLIVSGLATDANLAGAWYVDTGLGDALHEPLPLVAGQHNQGPFTFELAPSDGSIVDWQFRHHHLGSFPGMGFRAEPTSIEAFTARHGVLSTAPTSPFVTTMTAQRRDALGIDVLRGKVLRRVEQTITSETVLDDRSDWFSVLADVFGLALDVDSGWRAALWLSAGRTHQQWLETQSARSP